jgi:predicted 3-demethylubiquinone-9 3-methyltransferase (glyoxalase superfamily)
MSSSKGASVMNKIEPCLWFDHQAEEAAAFYATVFPHAEIGKTARYGESGSEVSGQKKGSVMTVMFQIENMKMMGLNGGDYFKFSPGISFFVWCETEKEIDEMWSKLSKGGPTYFELKQYPWAPKYGWCTDKFGVSWQLMLQKHPNKIAPAIHFSGKNLGKAAEAVQFYTKTFKNSKAGSLSLDPQTNYLLHGTFFLNETEFVMMEGPSPATHEITQATSFMISCKNQEEVDHYWETLSMGGEIQQCGWLRDKYGVAWQVIPEVMSELMSSKNPGQSEKVMKAMLTMKKLDIQKLEAAARS